MKQKRFIKWFLPALLIGFFFLFPGSEASAAGGEYLVNGIQMEARLKKLKPKDEWKFLMKKDIVLSKNLLIDGGRKITIYGNGHTLTFAKDSGFTVKDKAILTFSGGDGTLNLAAPKKQEQSSLFRLENWSKLVLTKEVTLRDFQGIVPLVEMKRSSEFLVLQSKIMNCTTPASLVKSSDGDLIYMDRAEIRKNTSSNNPLFSVNGGSMMLFGTKFGGNHSSTGTIGITGAAREDMAYLYIKDTVIAGNTASMRGGGLNLKETKAYLFDSTINGNHAGDRGGGVFLSQSSEIVLGAKVLICKNTAKDSKKIPSDLFFEVDEYGRKGQMQVKKLSRGSLIGLYMEEGNHLMSYSYSESGNTENPSRFFTSNNDNLLVRYSYPPSYPMKEVALQARPSAIDHPIFYHSAYGKIQITWLNAQGTEFRLFRQIGKGPRKEIYRGHARVFLDDKASVTEANYYTVQAVDFDYDGMPLPGEFAAPIPVRGDRLAGVFVKRVTWGVGMKPTFFLERVPDAEGFLFYRKEEGGEFKYIGMIRGTSFPDRSVERGKGYIYNIYAFKTLDNGKMILSEFPAEKQIKVSS